MQREHTAGYATHIRFLPKLVSPTLTLPAPVRYYSGTPLYPFGFGLSYANFTYSSLVISPSVVKSDQESVVVSGTLTHTGGQASDEVVQVYVRCIFGVP